MIVFTNGCFDLLHAGHVDLLTRARAMGDKLIVGLNGDASVAAIKGAGRPINPQDARRDVLLGLQSVDEVVIFDDATPEALIRTIRPDVLVKGGDWPVNQIVGADFVRSYGGSVHSLPLKGTFSSSEILQKATRDGRAGADVSPSITDSFYEHLAVMREVSEGHRDSVEKCSQIIFDTFDSGHKLLLCGNGGSAADAQHIAAEFVGRYETERIALPAIALTTDTSALTALANDYDFERIFSRQVDALAAEGDCLLAISTSGTSPNVIAAVMAARRRGCRIVGMTGANGKKLASLSDTCIMVPSERTARIQEAHITIAHVWCETIDRRLARDVK